MSFERKQVGETQKYRDHSIIVRAMAPDVLCEVDGASLPSFYINAEAARQGGMRYIDQIEKAKKQKESKKR